jgi:CheY-like chemotaxis protein
MVALRLDMPIGTQVFGRPRTAVHNATQRAFAGSKSNGWAALICSKNFGCKLMKSIARSVAVLVVEDEALIRMMIAGMIEELGHKVVGEAGNITEALNLATSADFSIAILDINLGGYRIEPVVEIIDRRGLPFVFASGYGAKGLPEKFNNRPVLQKAISVGATGKGDRSGVGRSVKYSKPPGLSVPHQRLRMGRCSPSLLANHA